jgi:hypothetical protein
MFYENVLTFMICVRLSSWYVINHSSTTQKNLGYLLWSSGLFQQFVVRASDFSQLSMCMYVTMCDSTALCML